ncbi:hypothetical protein [Hymenobacter cellulosivorans]|uniref:DUF4397 domain-containing protein n=1 Tax=Hymenobacter cellulosivorans TaxID=2932249 RepID=A0ABY4F771_9BACT|nr:hypothetical protein [Hymenobacter cellulosivorans]UOQ52522.1 hypothetical protein MUN80_22570 [Hymenobacter cellulosivorans]
MRTLYSAFVLLTLLSSCDSETTPEPGLPITGRIQVQALESRGVQGRALFLTFHDEGLYPCSNYGLITDYQRSGSQLSFVFSGVAEPTGICLTATGTARAQVDITNLPQGTYPLRLQVGSRTTTGVLELQSSYVRLQTDNPNLVQVTQPELRLMPPNLVWGDATTGLPADQASGEVLRDSLQQLGATPTTLPPGTYTRFTIAANGLLQPPVVPNGYRALLFLATYSGSPERIQAFVRRRNAATPGLNLHLNTSAQ